MESREGKRWWWIARNPNGAWVIAVIPFLQLLSDADRRSGGLAGTAAGQVGGQERTGIWTDKHEHV